MFADLKYAFRSLMKSPGFTTIALATLAIGIGANTAIFSFVNGLMLKPLPYANPDRIVVVLEKPPGGVYNSISTLNYLDWKRENTVFQSLAAAAGGSVTMTGVDEPVQLRGMRVSADYFEVFGVKAAVGRTFAPGEDREGHDRVVVISHALWQSRFGGERTVLGRTIRLDDQPYTIVGILPKDSAFDRSWPQIWRPLSFAPENRTRDFHWLTAVANLKPGVTLEQARANTAGIAAHIARDYPASNKGWGVAVMPIAEMVMGSDTKRSFSVLLGAVGTVLLIGCANLANLMLVRGLSRGREVAIRTALGAGYWQLMRQFFIESLLMSAVGAMLGMALGYAAMIGLKAVLPPYILPAEADVTMDVHVLLFTLLLAVLTGMVCGLAPALQTRRPDLTAEMKEGGSGAGVGRVQQRTRGALVVLEVALAFVLLVSAGLLLRTFAALQDVDTGSDPDKVLTAGFPLSQQRFATPEVFNTYRRQVHDAIAALPGVRDVAFTSSLPMQGVSYGMPFQRADRPIVDMAHRPGLFFKMVDPSYFRIIGLRLLKGRGLSDRDLNGTAPVAVINRAAQAKYFADEDPIGKRILIQKIEFGKTALGPEIPWEIVGVVADEKVGYLGDKEGSPGVYVTIGQDPQLAAQFLAIWTGPDPILLQQPIRSVVKRINPDQSLPEMKTLGQIKAESLGSSRLGVILLGIFASIALLLAAIGIYGVISYSVTQRTREIGVRAALGAHAGHIFRLVLRNGMKAVIVGTGLGAVVALVFTRVLSSFLFGVGERDPVTFVSIAGVLLLTALAACYLPARRATKVDPLVALRAE